MPTISSLGRPEHDVFVFLSGVAVYNVTVICLLAIIPSLFLKADDVNAKYVISSICILVATTLTQAIIFIPKVGPYFSFKCTANSSHSKRKRTPSYLPLHCGDCRQISMASAGADTGFSERGGGRWPQRGGGVIGEKLLFEHTQFSATRGGG